MRNGVNVLLAWGTLVALTAASAAAARADSEAPRPEQRPVQGGENLWVPSLTVSGGANMQEQAGFADSVFFPNGAPPSVPLQGMGGRDDFVVAPFVGVSIELMSPAVPVPTRPRFFVNGEILPTFGSERSVVSEGEATCVRGPDAVTPCAVDEDGSRIRRFDEALATGEGTRVTAEIEPVAYGAAMGMAFPFTIGERQLRIRTYASWLSYQVETKALVVNAECSAQCTTTTSPFPPFPQTPGFLRQPEALTAEDNQWFHGIGPGLDIEVDTGRFGPLGTSLFLGGRAYRVFGDRNIKFGTSQLYPADPAGVGGLAVADFEVDLDPWMYRAHVGLRLQWLGRGE